MEKTSLWEEFSRAFMVLRRMQMAALLSKMPPGDFFLLECLYKANGQVRVSTLAQNLESAPSAVSRMLRSLEEREWVARQVDKVDRRNTYVTLTSKGAYAREMAEKQMRAYFDKLCKHMGEEELRQWIFLSIKLQKSASAAFSEINQCRQEGDPPPAVPEKGETHE